MQTGCQRISDAALQTEKIMKKIGLILALVCLTRLSYGCAADAFLGCPGGNVGDRCKVNPGCGGGGGKTSAPGACVVGSYAGSGSDCSLPSVPGCYQNGYVCTVAGFWGVFFDACCSSACTADPSCAATTPIGSTCKDSCGNTYSGTKLASCSPPKFSPCGATCCDLSSGESCAIGVAGGHCCPSGSNDCNGACCNTTTHSCLLVGGIRSCVPNCSPACACAATTPVGSTCPDGCGGFCAGTKPACVPACGCAAITPIGSTCADGCGGTCAGAQCVPNCACAATTLIGSTCSNGCSGTCAGTLPPPPPCGTGKICGILKDSETGTVALNNVVLELRDLGGKVLQSGKTDGAGNYVLTAPAGKYYIAPVAARNQSPSKLSVAIDAGDKTDFTMRSVPAHVNLTGHPQTFVLITTFTWTSSSPPRVGGGTQTLSYTGVINPNSKWTAKVPYASDYWLSCWTLDAHHLYQKGSNVDLGQIKAQDDLTVACP